MTRVYECDNCKVILRREIFYILQPIDRGDDAEDDKHLCRMCVLKAFPVMELR